MNPLVANQTFNAILQIVTLLGLLASAASPLVKGLPTLYALLQRVAGAGFDLSKTFGATRVPTDAGPAPAPRKLPPSATIASSLMSVAISALFGVFFALMTCGFLFAGASCSAAKPLLVNALSVEQIACVLENESASEPPAIAAVCSIPPELVKEVEGLVLAARRARAMKDGGAK